MTARLLLRSPAMLSAEVGQKLNRTGDALLLVGASFVAASEHGYVHWKIALAMAATALACWAITSRILHQYYVRNGRGLVGDIALTLVLLVGIIVPLALLRLAIPRYAGTTEIMRFAWMIPAVLLLRACSTGVRLWRTRPIESVLIVGVGPLGRITAEEILRGERRRRPIGFLQFADEANHTRLRAPILGTADDLESVLKNHVVDEVYFATSHHHDATQRGIRCCERLGIPFALPACGYRIARATAQRALTDGYAHYLVVPNKPLQNGLKRLLDLLVSATALVVLSPLLVGVAIAIKVTSRGPIPFRQERVGLHGRTFEMLKFRTMVVNAEEWKAKLFAANEQSGPVFKMKRDPRVTRVGRFLRKYSIDELPQLINVLRGDMSIVGPRPPIPSEVALYEASQRRRLSVRPGLTCIWQVSGRSLISFEKWMLLDMRYIDNWSFFEDVRLILKTIPVVLTGRGAS